MRIVAVSFSGPSSRSRRSIPLAHVGVNVLLHAHLARVRIALLRACHPVVGPAEERRRRGFWINDATPRRLAFPRLTV